AKLTGRYRLANRDLELQIIDTWLGDTRASVKNLSGGEKFLASLALALGLAQVVGQKHRMETLFIDEGFGALDADTLETAVNALCSLQQQGKLIGIISHVDRVKERLPVRLELEPAGIGFSTLTGPGCQKLPTPAA
ncbi:MAG TPA: SbcC/MukB-like Walker B domain-containing protein, partial [Candidatus Ozemobacteraceae bacterium]|nr:SbcC/MukB-like Walker B domain-containing protein [Candidatus Ozemobacteraceae bacterium]